MVFELKPLRRTEISHPRNSAPDKASVMWEQLFSLALAPLLLTPFIFLFKRNAKTHHPKNTFPQTSFLALSNAKKYSLKMTSFPCLLAFPALLLARPHLILERA